MQVEAGLVDITSKLKLGSPLEFDTFLSAVIDGASFKRIKTCLDFAKSDSAHKVLIGGNATFEKGFFVEPTIVVTTDPNSKLLTNEIFGPVLTVYVFDDNKLDQTMELVDKSTPYGLTGAIFANDKYVRFLCSRYGLALFLLLLCHSCTITRGAFSYSLSCCFLSIK